MTQDKLVATASASLEIRNKIQYIITKDEVQNDIISLKKLELSLNEIHTSTNILD